MVQERPNTIKEVMERMPRVFQPDKAAGANVIFQYNFTGTEPGNWIVKVAEGKCEVSEGTADSPNVTINSPSDVWLKLARKELDGTTAFMTGQFTFKGDMGMLMKMQAWFA